MKTLHFSININAPVEKVWNALWQDANYRKWTAVFHEGSYAESDWEEGSKILFLAPGGDGMFSMIEKKTPNKQMTFKHLGELKNGVKESKDWENARESYFLSEKDGGTELKVELDSVGEFEQYFSETFPKALQEVKNIAEN
ncbi:MAG: SRPBCC domain-containing protein [Saprospiraceae bacterium]|nr:SRPBCC domain-containing protein [Saprospiraceae bacterium]